MIFVQRQRARQIQVHNLLPLFERLFLDRHIDPAATDVVDEYVDRSQLFERLLADSFTFVGNSDVGHQNLSDSFTLLNFARGCRQTFRIASDQNDIRARFRNCQSHLAAQSSAASRDEQPLAIQSKAIENIHVGFSGATTAA